MTVLPLRDGIFEDAVLEENVAIVSGAKEVHVAAIEVAVPQREIPAEKSDGRGIALTRSAGYRQVLEDAVVCLDREDPDAFLRGVHQMRAGLAQDADIIGGDHAATDVIALSNLDDLLHGNDGARLLHRVEGLRGGTIGVLNIEGIELRHDGARRLGARLPDPNPLLDVVVAEEDVELRVVLPFAEHVAVDEFRRWSVALIAA